MVAIQVLVHYLNVFFFFYRLDQYVKQTSKIVGEEGASLNLGGHTNNDDLGNVVDMSDFQVRFYKLFIYFLNNMLTFGLFNFVGK